MGGNHPDVGGDLDHVKINRQSFFKRLSFDESHGVAAFVQKVLDVYHCHFWLFVKLIAPAVVVGWITVYAGRNEAREIASHLPRGIGLLEHKAELFEMWSLERLRLVRELDGFFSLVRCDLHCGPSNRSRKCPIHPGCSCQTSRMPARLLETISVALCSMFGGIRGVDGPHFNYYFLSLKSHIHLDGSTVWILSFGLTGLALLVLSRFALAVPAVILDHSRVVRAVFRSDELTEGKWLALAKLLKS